MRFSAKFGFILFQWNFFELFNSRFYRTSVMRHFMRLYRSVNSRALGTGPWEAVLVPCQKARVVDAPHWDQV